MRSELLKPLGFIVALAASAGIILLLLPRVLSSAAGPEAAVLSQVKKSERVGLSLEVGDGPPLRSQAHQFQRISISVAAGGDAAELIGTLDFSGTVGETRVSSLGLERVPFRRIDGKWVAVDGLAPRLHAAVRALEARRSALEGGPPDRLWSLFKDSLDAGTAPLVDRVFRLKSRRYQAVAWLIRIEPDRALVREDFRLIGDAADRPVDELGSKSLVLMWNGREFFFPGTPE